MNFKEWMKEVDAQINKLIGFGLTSDDLADYLYDDAYDDGLTPEEAAIEAIKNDANMAGFRNFEL